jgi:hypothetical protein
MQDDKETIQVPRGYLQRLVDMADALYVYDNSEANQLKGYILALQDHYGIKPTEKPEAKK